MPAPLFNPHALKLDASRRWVGYAALVRGLGLSVPVAAECAGIRHVTAREPTAARTFLKNSFAFGGIHASLVCRRWTEGDPA